jgi:menaquinone-dependent protoporphyrinogen oxidase
MKKRFSSRKAIIGIVIGVMFLAIPMPQAQAWREKPEDVIEYTCGQENIEGKKILVAYDTDHGATSTIADTIAKVMCEQGFMVDLKLAHKVKDVSSYDALMIGTPIYYGSWLSGVMNFLKKYEQSIAAKPHVLFVNCTYLKEDTEEIRNKVMELWVTPILAKYPAIKPLDIGLFGGKILLEELYPLEYILMKLMKYKDGDFRDYEKIGAWAESMAATLK